MSNTNHLLEQVLDIAIAAGDRIMEVYESEDFGTSTKDDDSPLTKADLAAHQVIDTALAAISDWPRLSEEGNQTSWAERQKWEKYWLIDPLDGTKEFIKRNGEFTVNIALIDRGQPKLGVVHAPALDGGASFFGTTRAAWCADGPGAWLQMPAGLQEIRCRPCADLPIALISRSHQTPELLELLEKMPPHEAISAGSSLKFCRIAQGQADFYPRLGPTSEWDTGAAQAVVEAAGGQVVMQGGDPLPYNSKESFLNPWFYVLGDSNAQWIQDIVQA